MATPRSQNSRCGSCRRMKVKCDGQKPSCDRCTRAGRECPGYPSAQFVSMNSSSEDRALRLRYKRSKRLNASGLSDDSMSSSSSEAGRTPHSWPNTVIPLPKTIDWSHPAICYFISKYTLPSDSVWFSGGYLNFLPDMCARHSKGSLPLREAVKAASLAAYAAHTNSAEVTIQGRKAYGASLGIMRLSLDDPEVAHSDEILLAMWVLGTYELISGDKLSLWESHGYGQLQVLRMRGASLLDTSEGCHLYRFMFVRQQLRDIARRRMPTVKHQINPSQKSIFPSNLGASAIFIFTDITYAVARAQQIFDRARSSNLNDTNLDIDLITSLREMMDLNEKLLRWEQSALTMLDYSVIADKHTVGIPSHYKTNSTPQKLILFNNIHMALVWTRIWSGHLHVHRVLLEEIKIMNARDLLSTNGIAETRFRDGAMAMVDNICASTPYLLGDVDELGNQRLEKSWTAIGALVAIWLLQLVASFEELDDARFDWACGQMSRVGNSWARQGLVLRDYSMAKRRGEAVVMNGTW